MFAPCPTTVGTSCSVKVRATASSGVTDNGSPSPVARYRDHYMVVAFLGGT